MRIIEPTRPRPKLIYTVEPDLLLAQGNTPGGPENQKPRRRMLSARNGRIFLGVLGAAAVVALAIKTFDTYRRSHEPSEFPKLWQTSTHSVVKPAHPSEPPEPLTVQVSADMLQVTAISLGHPRMALINGKQVTEGDTIVVHTPSHSVAVTLKVLKISDGHIELFDGSQTFITRLTGAGSSTH